MLSNNFSATVAVGTVVVGGGVYLGYQTIGDWLSHHPRQYAKVLSHVEVVIKEQATNWNAHKIKLTITWSPDDKVTGKSAEHHTWHASSSRNACFDELAKKVELAYKAHK